MAEPHATHKFHRGDDWIIDGHAHNADWSAMDLADATVQWELKNAAGTVVLTMANATLTIIDAAKGDFRIFVGRDQTVAIAPGANYRDQCRITTSAVRSTQWYGVIEVEESYFESPLGA